VATDRAWRCASPVEEGAPVGCGEEFALTHERWLACSVAAAQRETGAVVVGRRQPDIGQSTRNRRPWRASRSDGWGKVALAPSIDASL
jgi:hypothetical protein